MKAFVYLRVSGRAQIEGDGFDRQLLACQQYARSHEIEVAEVFREEGISGTKELEDRPALSELFAALEENGVKTILIEKLDRLARDLMIQESIIRDMQKSGYNLLSVAEPDLCSDDPSRKLMRQIFGAIAEYDKAMVVLKLRGARQRKREAQGKCEGQKAFGELPGEADTLTHMHSLDAMGVTCEVIAANLNRHGFRTRSGRPWHRSTVAKILARNRANSVAAQSIVNSD